MERFIIEKTIFNDVTKKPTNYIIPIMFKSLHDCFDHYFYNYHNKYKNNQIVKVRIIDKNIEYQYNKWLDKFIYKNSL